MLLAMSVIMRKMGGAVSRKVGMGGGYGKFLFRYVGPAGMYLQLAG